MKRTNRARFAALVVAILRMPGSGSALADDQLTKPDPDDRKLVARGKIVYAEQCASCHGASLEGQPSRRHRLPNGRLPAPPHDPTWHT